MKTIKNNALWIFYFSFAALALLTHQGEPLFSVAGPYGIGKAITWLVLFSFLVYSIYCHSKENFFKTMKIITPYHWFRQVSLDLYLGLLIPLTLIYLNEGSLVVVAIWFVPIFFMANLATLLYLAMNYQSLVAHFS